MYSPEDSADIEPTVEIAYIGTIVGRYSWVLMEAIVESTSCEVDIMRGRHHERSISCAAVL